jgi:hypothetical protein
VVSAEGAPPPVMVRQRFAPWKGAVRDPSGVGDVADEIRW